MDTNDVDPQLISKRYRLEKLLGEGGMGAVYRGIDSQTNQIVAIKLLRLEKIASQPTLAERFSREAEALRTLNHPNIVKVLATFTEENQQYIVMEFVEKGSLHGLLRREGPLTVTQTAEIALDLADALTRAHRLEIIHRDLKPANVLLADDGTVRLSDFGIAKVTAPHSDADQDLTKEGTIIGTIDYLSPEACRGEAVDARADIWALGVILFEMLVGKRPFPNRSTPLPSSLPSPLFSPNLFLI